MSYVVKRSLGVRAKKIALNRGIPYITTETVIKDYLASLVESLLNGERVVLDGLTSISVIRDVDTGELYARGRVSPALKSKLANVSVIVEKETPVEE